MCLSPVQRLAQVAEVSPAQKLLSFPYQTLPDTQHPCQGLLVGYTRAALQATTQQYLVTMQYIQHQHSSLGFLKWYAL